MKTVKILILVMAFTLLGFDGCKTHKVVQSSRQVEKAVNLDSSWLKKDSVSVDTSKKQVQVQKESKVVEEYSETNIVIHAPDKSIVVDGMTLDSTSTLDSLRFSSAKPKKTLDIYKGIGNVAVARLKTPTGEQVFKDWSSIEINTKKYKKTTTGKSDSTSNELISKILKNSIDSGHKAVDSTSKVEVRQMVIKDSRISFWGLMAGFWWIPASLVAILLILWKWPSIINLFKRK